ncbi:MarR family winged helix-turn-helix transcriptional regulator [Bacillus sp. AK128]
MDLKKILLEANLYADEIKTVMIEDYKKILDEHDLSTKQSVVLGFLEKKEKLNMNEVANIINGTPSAASQFIKKLENKDYVQREVNKENRREVFVLLGKNGKKFFKEMNELDEKVLEKYFLQLPEEDILKYHEILKKLHGMITKEL